MSAAMRCIHDCPDCTHPKDDYKPGTLLRVKGEGCESIWFKSRADRFAWQQVYGPLRWETGGYNMPSMPHTLVAVLDA